MRRFIMILLAATCLMAGCASDAPRPTGRCIPGDPAGPPACQAYTYLMAF